MELHELKNTHRKSSKVQRVGRGPGSKRGKTSCRGEKGYGSRSGYKRRYGYEGGRQPLHRKLPIRGFTRGRFKTDNLIINLQDIDELYSDNQSVSLNTLIEKKRISSKCKGKLKILAKGELTKKVSIEASYISPAAIEKLQKNNISYTLV